MFRALIDDGGLLTPRLVLPILGGDNRLERITETVALREAALRPLEGEQDPRLAERVARLWPDTDSATLVARALREAAVSRLFSGTTPETWSPLGAVSHGDAGLLLAQEGLGLDDHADMPPAPMATLGTSSVGGSIMLTLTDDGPLGAAIFSDDAFLVALPPGTSGVLLDYEPDAGRQTEEAEEAERALREWLPEGELTTVLLWRAYVGGNTVVVDGMTELIRSSARRITLAAARASGVVVGRVAFAIHRRTSRSRQDPTARRRLLKAEMADAGTAERCPRLDRPAYRGGPMLVAVHGTMSCAMPMAAALSKMLPGAAVHRFEHDTWLPVGENARDLAAQLAATGASRVVMVAHSRGGLVAREAAQILARDGDGDGVDVEVVTLGTPFLGTPIVAGVRGGLLGVQALMGAVRALSGGVVVDAGTRLAGLLIKRGVPAGIEAMDERSVYLDVYRNLGPTVAAQHVTSLFGGSVDIDDPAERYGLAIEQGFASQAFGGFDNDLVVGATSATLDAAPGSQVVACDHFSYLTQDEVRAAIVRVVNLPSALAPHVAAPVAEASPVKQFVVPGGIGLASLSGKRTNRFLGRSPEVRFEVEERRWPAEVESAVYFAVFQLLRAKRASTVQAVVTIRQENRDLVVLVQDDPLVPYDPPDGLDRFRSAMKELRGTVTESQAPPNNAVEARLPLQPAD
jgi:hypothetical protein